MEIVWKFLTEKVISKDMYIYVYIDLYCENWISNLGMIYLFEHLL